jgi:putative heme-binding domain-containing protein
MSGSGTKSIPEGWQEALLGLLSESPGQPELLVAAIRTVRSLPFPKEGNPTLVAALQRLASSESVPAATRTEAIAGLPAGTRIGEVEFSTLREALMPNRTPTEKLAAANAAARLRFDPAQLQRFAPTLATAGPLELPRLFVAFASGGDESLGKAVLSAIQANPSLRAIRPDDLKPQLAKFPESIRQAADLLLAANQSDASKDRERLDAMLAEILKLDGQIRRGQNIFNSTKAACVTCHRLGYLGGDLGPDLTSIGQARTERDLLEALVYPSVSLVRSYEPWIAETKDGEEFSGVIRKDTPDEIVLATGPGAETRIRRSDLKELRLGTMSIMPAGLDEQLSRQELADLIAFLKNTKWGVN